MEIFERSAPEVYEFPLAATAYLEVVGESGSQDRAMTLEGNVLVRKEEGSIYIYGKDEGGGDAWGQVSVIHAGDGVANFGKELELLPGILVVAMERGGRTVVQLFAALPEWVLFREPSEDLGGASDAVFFDADPDASTGDVQLATLKQPQPAVTEGVVEGIAEVLIYGSGPGGPSLMARVDAGQVRGSRLLRSDLFVTGLEGVVEQGLPVSLSGGELLTGFAEEDYDGGQAWAAVVRERVAGNFQISQRLGEAGNSSEFGRSVATHRAWMVAGAPGDDGTASTGGSVYLWHWRATRGGQAWIPLLKFSSPAPTPADRFGEDVEIYSGSENSAGMVIGAHGPAGESEQLGLIAVGAPGDDGVGVDLGSVSLFERSEGGSYEFVVKELQPASAKSQRMGSSVGVAPGVLVAASRVAPGFYPAVFVFRPEEGGGEDWEVAQTIGQPAGTNLFAESVSLGERFAGLAERYLRLAVGAPGGGETSGEVFMYESATGGVMDFEQVAVLGGTPETGEGFGAAVDFRGNTLSLLVGAPSEGTGGSVF